MLLTFVFVNHELYMQRCLELAQRAKGYTAPNPMVGAVLVHEGRIIGEGWHHYYGSDHAEVTCLNNVAEQDKHLIPQSTMFVNLEPCAHHGKTPPCATRLVAEKVKEVVIANVDPFAQVSGRGIHILQNAGIQVTTGVLEKEGQWLNRRFFNFHQQNRPYIILKWAQTQDGFIAPADKSRLQISGAASRTLLHKWRTEEGAIMVGTNTAMHDDPELTARLWKGKQPLRIMLDREEKLPHTLKLYNEAAATWVVNEKQESLQGNIHFVQLDFDDTLLPHLLRRLYDVHILSIIIEGGAALLSTCIAQGLWDEARIFTAPTRLGEGIAAPVLNNYDAAFTSKIGEDLLNVYVNKKSAYSYAPGMEL